MRHHEFLQIAAIQIGISKRIFVTEIRKTKFRIIIDFFIKK